MTDYIRTQVLLEKTQRKQLAEIAEKEGISFSELVRSLINEQPRLRVYENMRIAAQHLSDDYAKDNDLTALQALDGEDFLNA